MSSETMAPNYTSCLKWKFEPEEYDIGKNRNIIVSGNGNLSYSYGEYAINNESEAVMCIPRQILFPFYVVDVVCSCLWVISAIFLTISALRLIQNPPKGISLKPLLCHQISLIAYYVISIGGHVAPNDNFIVSCLERYATIYAIRASFSWLTVINFDVWRNLGPEKIARLEERNNKKFCLQFLFAWSVPALTFVIPSGLRLFADQKDPRHVANQEKFELIFIYACTQAMLAFDVVLFIWTLFKFQRCKKNINRIDYEDFAKVSHFYLKILTVCGICWIIHALQWPLSILLPSHGGGLADLVLGLQGLYIFLACNYAKFTSASSRKLVKTKKFNNIFTLS